jgi:uncharacterized membrane protein
MMSKVKMKHGVLALLLVLGIVSRFLNIDAQGIKIDETWVVPTPNFHFEERSIYPKLFDYQQYKALSPARQSLLKTIYETHPIIQITIIRAVSDVHPPLFFVLNYYWSRLAGFDLWAIRSPAAIYWIFAALVLPLFLLSQGVNIKVVILSLFLVVISPFYLFLSNYARPYTLLVLLNLLSCYLAYNLFAEGFTRRRTFLYIVVCLASLYTHYYAVFVVIAQAAYLAYESLKKKSFRNDVRKLCIMYAIIVLAFLPWVAVLFLQKKWRYAGIESAGSLRYFNLEAVMELLLFFGPAYSRSTVHSVLNYVVSLLQVVFVVLGVRSLWQTRDSSVSRFWLFMLIVPLAVGGIANSIIPVFSPRNFTIVMIPYFVVCAIGISSLRIRMIRVASLVGIGAVGLYFTFYGLASGNVRGELALEDWRGVAHFIQARYPAEPRTVYVYDSSFRDALYYHLPSQDRVKGLEDQNIKIGPKEERFLLVIMNHSLEPDEAKVMGMVPFLLKEDTCTGTLVGKFGGAHIYDVTLKRK